MHTEQPWEVAVTIDAVIDLRVSPSLHAAEQLGLTAAPTWVDDLGITDCEQQWLADRWDPEAQVLTFQPAIDFTVSRHRRIPTVEIVELGGLPDRLVAEVVVHLLLDQRHKKRHQPSCIRALTNIMRDAEAATIHDINPAAITYNTRALRRWQRRPWCVDAAAEWDRGRAGVADVRVAVVDPNNRTSGLTLPFTGIQQQWLRDLAADVTAANLPSVSTHMVRQSVDCLARLSKVLATRQDGGNHADRLGRGDMQTFAAAIGNDTTLMRASRHSILEKCSAVLGTARRLGFAEQVGLPYTFALASRDYPPKAPRQFSEKGFNNALFALLIGATPSLANEAWGFGAATLNLARSIPGSPVDGDMFVAAIQAGANFGRRTTEVLSLPHDRVQQDHLGRWCLRYDDFKSRRDGVLLPIDSHSADLLSQWQSEVQQRFPDTPTQDLVLFSAPTSRDGTTPVQHKQVGAWFKAYVIGLEQAIVMGQLHAALTGVNPDVTLEQVAALACSDITATGIRINDRVIGLPDRDKRMVTDYLADARARMDRWKIWEVDREDRPVFPHPHSFTGRPRPNGGWGSTPVDFFNPLSGDWRQRACDYPSPGLPATHFGTGRLNPDAMGFNTFRHTYLQTLVNLGTDIFLVAELAGHSSPAVTMNAYVAAPQDLLVEAAERLVQFRSRLGQRPVGSVTLGMPGVGAKDAITDCTNPDVHRLGMRGCRHAGVCAICDDSIWDPSHLLRITARIAELDNTLMTAAQVGEQLPGQVEYFTSERDAWRGLRDRIQDALDALTRNERHEVIAAAEVVMGFRDRRFNSAGVTFGSAALPAP